MEYLPKIKDTLLIPSGPNDKQHLFVILTNECRYKKHILVSFSTITESKLTDYTCRVEPGEHEFITVPSYLAYRFARHDFSSHLKKCVPRIFSPHKPVSDSLYQRICSGLLVSDATPFYALRCMEGRCRG